MAETKRINIALQGGGSHGAFTWGVLDALIEDGRLVFEAVSGTSAGAMNAAIMLQGWANGGPAGARAALAAFWGELGQMAVASPIRRTPLDRLQGNWNLDESAGALWADIIQRTLSPWQRNPLKFDPLRDLLRRHLSQHGGPKDPAALQAWYKRHLGIDVQEWGGTAFSWADAEGKPAGGTTIWSVGAAGSDTFAPGVAQRKRRQQGKGNQPAHERKRHRRHGGANHCGQRTGSPRCIRRRCVCSQHRAD